MADMKEYLMEFIFIILRNVGTAKNSHVKIVTPRNFFQTITR